MQDELRSGAKKEQPIAAYSNGPMENTTEDVIREIQDLMWQDVGIVREAEGLKRAIGRLEEISPRLARPVNRRGWEALNLCDAGLLVSRCALAREESRGAHYRTDFPEHDDARFLKHSIAKNDSIRFA
jgi:L-aspartate oxidase